MEDDFFFFPNLWILMNIATGVMKEEKKKYPISLSLSLFPLIITTILHAKNWTELMLVSYNEC